MHWMVVSEFGPYFLVVVRQVDLDLWILVLIVFNTQVLVWGLSCCLASRVGLHNVNRAAFTVTWRAWPDACARPIQIVHGLGLLQSHSKVWPKKNPTHFWENFPFLLGVLALLKWPSISGWLLPSSGCSRSRACLIPSAPSQSTLLLAAEGALLQQLF